MLSLSTPGPYQPLDTIIVESDAALVQLLDGQGRCYAEQTTDGADTTSRHSFQISGTLGYQNIVTRDASGAELERHTFRVHARTQIKDQSGRIEKFLNILKHAHTVAGEGKNNILLADGEIYRMHSVASRDNVHAMKGAMYFMDHMQDGPDLHARYQREDGLVWDFATSCERDLSNGFEWRFEEEFCRRSDDRGTIFARQPAENDVEHMHIRGIWQAWKCSGNDTWMADKLDSALRAMRFSGSSEWFWSNTFELLKRPFTIDTWDFTSLYDKYSLPLSGDCGLAKPGVTVYGVMHGDNTGMADSCDKLAEMLRVAGRDQEAAEAQAFADGLRKRLDNVAWNGEFFTHHVSEDPSYQRDFGVDESTQVSLSNAYALNRGIRHEQAVAIIKTYQRIRAEMPTTSPGEFFMIYPPFQKGWGPHASAWQYTNGAVTGIVAGELARGAFVHGFEDYGVDILDRWLGLMEDFSDRLPWGLRGAMPTTPERSFRCLDLRSQANADLAKHDDDVPGWQDDPGMDLRELPRGKQTLEDIPFDIIDGNERRSLLRIGKNTAHYAEQATVAIGDTFRSLYFLHAAGGGSLVGEVCFHYSDGSTRSVYMKNNEQVFGVWNPPLIPGSQRGIVRKDDLTTVIAWRGACPRFWSIGLTAHGVNNPRPDSAVDHIELKAMDGGKWLIVGMTTSDAPAFFMPSREGHGVPEPWQAGALTSAIIEGLAGVVDSDRNFQAVTLSPRWSATLEDQVQVCVTYADGGGYLAYTWQRDETGLHLRIAGNSDRRDVALLLPAGFTPGSVTIDGQATPFDIRTVEQSQYLHCSAQGVASMDLHVQAV